MCEEIWLDILGFENYMISNKGRVWSKTRVIKGAYNSRRLKIGQIIPFHKGDRGYYIINLTSKNGKKKTKYKHRLVAEAFIPNPLNKPQVNHINGDKLNSDIDNLEWCTASENCLHAIETSLYSRQKIDKISYKKRKLTSSQVEDIKKKYRSGQATQGQLSIEYDISQSTISDLINGKRYIKK